MRTLLLLLALLAVSFEGRAQSPPTQCVSVAIAGGTGDAITIPRLPCQSTTTLLILTFSSPNSTTTPTIQQIGIGGPAPVVNFNGAGPIAAGTLQAGQTRLLSYNGRAWYVLTGGIAGFVPTTIQNVLSYGADPTGTNDNAAAFQNAIQANCGGYLFVPPGTYLFTNQMVANCGLNLVLAGTSAKLKSALGGGVPFLVFQGSTGTSTALTANATVGQTSITVTSPSGLCAATTNLPNPSCAVKISSNVSYGPLGHLIGEIHLIQSISGNTVNLFEPIEDNYNTADTAIATPTALISDLRITGGKLVGPTTDNTNVGLQIQGCYNCSVKDTVSTGFNGEGNFVYIDSLISEFSHLTCIGIANATLADAYCASVQDASKFVNVHDVQCYSTGPCGTLEDGSINPGTQQHIRFYNDVVYAQTGINEGGFGTHYSGTDITWNNVTCVEEPNLHAGVNHCVGIAIANTAVTNSHSWYTNSVAFAAEIATNQTGYFRVLNSEVVASGQHCIDALGSVVGGTGTYSVIDIRGNTLVNCGQYGIGLLLQPGGGGPQIIPQQVNISQNTIYGWGSLYDAIRAAPIVDNAQIDNNVMNGLTSAGNGITGGDFSNSSLSHNKIANITRNCMTIGNPATSGISAVKIDDNLCATYGSAGSYSGFITQDAMTNFSVSGWLISGAGAGADGAIDILGLLNNGAVDNNTIVDAQGYGINYSAGTQGANVSFSHNRINGYNLKAGEFHGIDVGSSIVGLSVSDNMISGAGGTTASAIAVTNPVNFSILNDTMAMPNGIANYALFFNFTGGGFGGGITGGHNISVPGGTAACCSGVGYDPTAANGVNALITSSISQGYSNPLLIGTGTGNHVTWPQTATSGAILPAAGSCGTANVTIPGAANLANVVATPNANPGAGVVGATTWMSSPGSGIATIQACALSGASPNSITYNLAATK